MKRQPKPILLLSLSLLLASCGGENPSSPSSQTPSSDPSSDSASQEIAVPDYVYTQIQAAGNSYRMKARESETVKNAEGNVLESNVYQYDILNDASSTGGIHQISIANGSSTVVDYVRGERGYVAEEGLSYANEIFQTEALIDSSKAIYDQEFANPFLFLVEGDLTASGENHFLLSQKKSQLFAKYLLGAQYAVEKIEFVYEGEALTQILVDSSAYSMTYQDANSKLYIPATLTYRADCRFQNLGSSRYAHLEKAKSKDAEKEAILQKAFQAMGDNFTAAVNCHYQDEEPNSEYDTYWYFTGDAVYHQSHIDDQTQRYDLYYHKGEGSGDKLYLYDYDETAGEWIYNSPIYGSSYNVDPQDYSYFLPKFASMAPELFTYDEDKGAYVCQIEAAVRYLGNDFLGGGYKTSYFTQGKGNQAEVYLSKSKTKVDKVVVGYKDVDSQGYDVSRSYTLSFLNVGNTKLPSFVK